MRKVILFLALIHSVPRAPRHVTEVLLFRHTRRQNFTLQNYEMITKYFVLD